MSPTRARSTEPATDSKVAVEADSGRFNIKPMLKLMAEKKASDLFFTSNSPVKIKIEGLIYPINKQVLTAETGARDRAQPDERRAARALPERTRDRFRDLGTRRRPLPRRRVPPARLPGAGAALYQRRHAEARRARPAGHASRSRDAEARPGADGRRHRRRQIDDARGDDQPPQRELLGPHPDDRGPDRVPAPEPQGDRQPARGRARHAHVHAARCAPRCARRRT